MTGLVYLLHNLLIKKFNFPIGNFFFWFFSGWIFPTAWAHPLPMGVIRLITEWILFIKSKSNNLWFVFNKVILILVLLLSSVYYNSFIFLIFSGAE